MRTKAAKEIEEIAGVKITFGKAVWAIRISEEHTQEIFAKRLGVSKQYLSALENDKKIVSVKQAQRIAKVLGQSEQLFVKYALQDMLRNYALPYEVDLRDAA